MSFRVGETLLSEPRILGGKRSRYIALPAGAFSKLRGEKKVVFYPHGSSVFSLALKIVKRDPSKKLFFHCVFDIFIEKVVFYPHGRPVGTISGGPQTRPPRMGGRLEKNSALHRGVFFDRP